MEKMVGGAVEQLCGHGVTGKPLWLPRIKSLLLKRVLPLKRISYLSSRLNSLPTETAVPDRILEVLGVTYQFPQAIWPGRLSRDQWWWSPITPLAQSRA